MAPAGPLPAQGAPIPQIPRDPWEDGSFNRRLIGCQDLELADGAILGLAKPAGGLGQDLGWVRFVPQPWQKPGRWFPDRGFGPRALLPFENP